MRDYGPAIGLVLAIEGLLMAGFADWIRTRMATAAGKDPVRLRGVCPDAAVLGVAIVWASRLLLWRTFPVR
jgi:uncharacterized protein YjeT (DUF2065 family)